MSPVIVGRALALALGALFVVAAQAKISDRPATARGFRALGFRATYPLAVAVPAVELTVAALLVIVPRVGALAAVALLGLFSAVLADRLRRGIAAPCNCFGSTDERPLSTRHLLRNGVLAASALVVALASPWQPSPAIWMIPGAALLAGVYVIRQTRKPLNR